SWPSPHRGGWPIGREGSLRQPTTAPHAPTYTPRYPHHLTGRVAKSGVHPGYILVPASLHRVQWHPSQTRHTSITAWLPERCLSPLARALWRRVAIIWRTSVRFHENHHTAGD